MAFYGFFGVALGCFLAFFLFDKSVMSGFIFLLFLCLLRSSLFLSAFLRFAFRARLVAAHPDAQNVLDETLLGGSVTTSEVPSADDRVPKGK